MDEKKIVVVAGATGRLGKLIVQFLTKTPNVVVRALVRLGSATKASELASLGAEVIEVAIDGSGQPEALSKAMQGAYSVVSALQGGDDVLVDAQSRILKAAVAAGVRRFIPSDYSVDFTRMPEGTNRNFDTRSRFHKAANEIIRAAKSDIEFTSIFQGAFTELLASGWMFMNFEKHQVQYFGSPDTKMDFTTWSDTAEYTAAVAVDESSTPKRLNVSGMRVSPLEIQQIANRVTGTEFELKRMMSIGMLRAMIGLMKVFKPGKGEPMPMWVGMQYALAMALGTGATDHLDNDRYPEIMWTGIHDTVKRAFEARRDGRGPSINS